MLLRGMHSVRMCLVPLAVIVPLVGGVVVIAVALSSCRSSRQDEVPVTLVGVPMIRVRLTASPVKTAALSTTGGYSLCVDGRAVLVSDGALQPTEVKRSPGVWLAGNLVTRGSRALLEPVGRSLVRFDGTTYRGKLHLLPADGGFHVVNHVDLESYLAGVLARELYVSWSLQTYRALAVAARTYALYKKSLFGPGRDYDVLAGVSDQVYGGLAAETDKSWDAVRSTRGWVLAYGPEGNERIFLTQYSSSNGGYVNGAEVIRAAPDIPPLRGGQKDPDGPFSPTFRWGPVRISKADLLKAVAASYSGVRDWKVIKEIRVARRTSYGRAVWLDIVGKKDGQTLRIRAEDLRLCLLRVRKQVPAAGSMRSMNCRMRDLGDAVEFYDGRGFGHGVGLSQWGAEAKAQRGWSAGKILEFYYPGAKLFRAY